MGYLLPAEYEAYGPTTETADAWVTTASAMIEAYCRRPSLMTTSYVERLRLGRRNDAVRLSYGPLVSVDAARARFGWNASLFGAGCGTGELDTAAAFCAPGSWVDLDVTTLDVDTTLAEVEVTYSAGFAQTPEGVKVACAQIVKNAQATPGLNVRQSRVDTLQMQYFSDSLLDSQVKALLQPYVAERLS